MANDGRVPVPDTTAEYRDLKAMLKGAKWADERVKLEQAEQVATHQLPAEPKGSEIWCHRVLALYGGQTV